MHTASTRTISTVIAIIGALKAPGDGAGHYGPAVLAAPQVQEGG